MALANFYEYNIDNFVEGSSRLLYSILQNGTLENQPIPANIAEVFATESPYDPVTTSGFSPWVDLGALTAPPEFVQTPSVNNVKIQQQIATVLQIPTELVDTVKFQAAELSRIDILQMLHNAGASSSVASGSGYVASTALPFGQFTDLTQYRLAIAVPLVSEAGLVTESGGATRPRLLVQVLNRGSLDASATTLTYARGEIVSAELTFRLLPEPGALQNQELGVWFEESVGTISD